MLNAPAQRRCQSEVQLHEVEMKPQCTDVPGAIGCVGTSHPIENPSCGCPYMSGQNRGKDDDTG